jgi:hypothetical protein
MLRTAEIYTPEDYLFTQKANTEKMATPTKITNQIAFHRTCVVSFFIKYSYLQPILFWNFEGFRIGPIYLRNLIKYAFAIGRVILSQIPEMFRIAPGNRARIPSI